MGELLSREVIEAVEQLTPYFIAKIKQAVIEADIIPDATGTRNLGSSTKRFDTVYAENIKADVVEAARAFLEGVGVNLIRNGSFEQVVAGFTNQPEYWTLAMESELSSEIAAE